MKIAFINIMTPKKMHIGVEKKLKEQAFVMSKKNIDVYVLNREKNGFIDNINYIDMQNFLPNNKFADLYLKLFKLKILEKVIDLTRYDYLILRYPLMDFSSIHFSNKYHGKIITEHHGKYIGEIGSYRINPLFKVGQLYLEKILSKQFFKHVKIMIGISDDVLLEEKERTGFQGYTIRYSNGVNPDQYLKRKIPQFDDEFNILFMATSFAEWHGLDRLLKSLKNYNGSTSLVIHLVGEVNKKYIEQLATIEFPENLEIKQYGKVSNKNTLDEIYNQCHMAFNSIAMHRIGMEESSTLKSKEYIVKSLPFVYSAKDPDLYSVDSYLFKIENDESLFQFEDIVSFYKKIDLIKMQSDFFNLVYSDLTWESKIDKLIEKIGGLSSEA